MVFLFFLQLFVIRPDSDIFTNILTNILVCGFGFLEFNVLLLFYLLSLSCVIG